MADSDLIEWRLLAPNLTTVIGILPHNGGNLYIQLNEPGSGALRLALGDSILSSIVSGCYAQATYRGAVRGGFFVENIEKKYATAEEGGGQYINVSGRGSLALLEQAKIWNDGSTSSKRIFTNYTKAHILTALI